MDKRGDMLNPQLVDYQIDEVAAYFMSWRRVR
jgi:hypothetical protein